MISRRIREHHRALGSRPTPAAGGVHGELRDDLGLEFLPPLLHPDKQAVPHVLELLDRRIVGAAGAPLGLEDDRLLDPRQAVPQLDELRVAQHHRIDHLLGHRLLEGDLAPGLGVHDRQLGIDHAMSRWSWVCWARSVPR